MLLSDRIAVFKTVVTEMYSTFVALLTRPLFNVQEF